MSGQEMQAEALDALDAMKHRFKIHGNDKDFKTIKAFLSGSGKKQVKKPVDKKYKKQNGGKSGKEIIFEFKKVYGV